MAMEMAPNVPSPNAPKHQRSFSETRATPPKAVYKNFGDAHANITGRANQWPLLCPGWQKDQPARLSNLKSLPLECVARVVPPSVATGHVIAAQGAPLRHRSVVPSGPPEIPAWEVGQIDSKFPSLSRPECFAEAEDHHHSQSLLPNTSANDRLHRRSHSLSHLPGIVESYSIEGPASLRPGSTVSNIYQSYARDQADSPPDVSFNLNRSLWSRPSSAVTEKSGEALADDESEEFPMRIHQTRAVAEDLVRASPVQSSLALRRRAELAQHRSFESFQAWIEDHSAEVESSGETDSQLDDHVARVVLLSPDGQVRSRPMSQIELDDVAQHVRRQLEDPENLRLVPNDHDALVDIHGDIFRPYGRLLIQYDAEHEGHETAAPYSSRSSSSISYGTYHLQKYGHRLGQEPPHLEGVGTPRTRSGTPPLLYGASQFDRLHHEETINGIESEIDWETVDGTMTQMPRPSYLPVTVSSHADYSSSSSGVKQRGLPPGVQTLGHPPHPRYAQSWNMLRDEQTGRTILLDEGSMQGASTSPRNFMMPIPSQGRVLSDYHHPSPLSQEHPQLFGSSPQSLAPQPSSPGWNSSPLPRARAGVNNFRSFSGNDSLTGGRTSDEVSSSEAGSSVLEMVSKSEANRRYHRLSSKKELASSAWLSTSEGVEVNGFVEQRAPEGAFEHIVTATRNVRGTPEGTGAHKAGSSLANTSSPPEIATSSPFHATPKTPKSQTVNSSFVTARTRSANLSNENYEARPSSVYSNYFEDQNLTALPAASSHFPLAISDKELREHRKQLVAHKLLPEEEAPDARHRSLPMTLLAPLRNVTAATGAALGRQFHQILPQLRQRSPQRGATYANQTAHDLELATLEETPAKFKKPQRTRDAKKRKVSDSEESNGSPNHKGSSPSTRLLGMATTGPRASHTTSVQPVELEGVTIHPTTSAHASDPTFRKAVRTRQLLNPDGSPSQAQRGRTTTQIQPINATPMVRPNQGSVQHLRRLQGFVSDEWKGLYANGLGNDQSASEVIRSIIPVQRPIQSPDFIRGGLPRARAASPHLIPFPRVRDLNKERKQKKQISLLFFFLCGLCPPMFALYGWGYLDGVATWCSDGEITAMGSEEKFYGKLMACLTGVLMCCVIIGAVSWAIFKSVR